jgi:outer membrane protein TolC
MLIAPAGFASQANAQSPMLTQSAAPAVPFVAPAPAGYDKPLPVNLATALQLTNSRAWDIAIASERVRVAAAQLAQKRLIWVPSVIGGTEYTYHAGANQSTTSGAVADVTRSSLFAGMAPYAVFGVTDAIFEPLAARQVLRAQEATLQTVTNDTTFAVAEAYFTVEEARGNLSGAIDVVQRTTELLRRTEKLAPDLIPNVEVSRAKAQLARMDQSVQSARERWRVTGAELLRILRLDPLALVEPVEPPHMAITLISPERQLEELLPVALAYRPELAAYRAYNEAAVQRWREEKWRPFLPTILARGGATQTPYPLAYGAYAGANGTSLNDYSSRTDFDVQAIWELKNLGLGNRALIRERRADQQAAMMQVTRMQDFVAREVAQAFAQVQSASIRIKQAEEGIQAALTSATENYNALGQTKRVGGNINILVIRPQEAVAAVQELTLAYGNYYGAVADYNRAQFRLYRALGNPAQALASESAVNPVVQSNPGAAQQPVQSVIPPTLPAPIP